MGKPKVLIVDDILVNRMLLSDIATSIGCECTLAKNGKEAIDLIMENDFNMVIMDIEMPVKNGLETTCAIRKIEGRKSQIPVIALTAHDPADFFSEYSACGFNELITKPYLITKIQKLVDDFCR